MIKKFPYEYVTYEELYEAYLDCRKRKRSTINSLKFEINENIHLYKLWHELNSKEYKIGKSIAFCVEKPVKREIFAADFRDRIVHHLLIRRINNILEEEFIEDSYSCRKGKGTSYGVNKCYEYVNYNYKSNKESYIIKCDLKSFFMTIDKSKLYNKLCKFIKENYKSEHEEDYNFIYFLLNIIIFNKPQKNCILKQKWENWKDLPKSKSLFFCEDGYGLPIGNLTSQIFANFYLSEFDKFVKNELQIQYYGRYVDDFFMIVDSDNKIGAIINKCSKKLQELGLFLHPNKIYVQKINKGIKFIGSVIKHNRIYIANRTKGNMHEKIKHISIELEKIRNKDEICNYVEYACNSINSYIGFMVHYKTFNIRKNILLSNMMKNIYEYCYVNSDLTKMTLFKDYSKRKNAKHFSKNEYYKSYEFLKLIYKFS